MTEVTSTNGTAPVTETTASAPEVSKPLVTAKPYDDEIFSKYESEAKEESESTETEEPVKEEAVQQPPKVEEAKSKASDKIEDGFEEVVVKKPINGKEVSFKVKDAIQAFVKQQEFNRNMDKRLSDVGRKEHTFNSQVQEFKGKIGQVAQIALKGDFITAMRGVAKLAVAGTNLNPVDYERKFFNQLAEAAPLFLKMTPEQKDSFFSKRDLAEAQARAKALEDEKTAHVEKSHLQERVALAQKEHDIPEQEFWNNYKVIAENLVGKDKYFQDSQEIQVDDVVKYTTAARHENRVVEASKKFGIADKETLDLISETTKPTMSAEEIAIVIEKSGIAKNANPQSVENLNRKAQKSGTQFNQANSTKKNGNSTGYDKETLDFLNRHRPKVYNRPVR